MDIHKHPLLAEFTGLMHDIEALGASPELTAVSVKAHALRWKMEQLLDEQHLTPLSPDVVEQLSHLAPHETRVVLELRQLRGRHGALEGFLYSLKAKPTAAKVSEMDRQLLNEQSVVMQRLVEVLEKRVSLIGRADELMVLYRTQQPPCDGDPLGQMIIDVATPLSRFSCENVNLPAGEDPKYDVMTRAELDEKHPDVHRV